MKNQATSSSYNYNYTESETWDDGYEWADENYIDDEYDCEDEFNSQDAIDGCIEYVEENKSYNDNSFHGYTCTDDCSGHEAGYEWAEENEITDTWDCGGNSQSFIEGCEAYVEEYY